MFKPLSSPEILFDHHGFIGHGFSRWVFYSGMLFNAPDKWWGDYGKRGFPHEGLDLCLYKDSGNRLRQLDYTTKIRAIDVGFVQAIFKDYLGRALIIEHHDFRGANGKFLSIYAHTVPRVDLRIGQKVEKGEVIATIADTQNVKAKIWPHLHLSIGIPSAAMTFDLFEWKRLCDSDLITLLNPLRIVDPLNSR